MLLEPDLTFLLTPPPPPPHPRLCPAPAPEKAEAERLELLSLGFTRLIKTANIIKVYPLSQSICAEIHVLCFWWGCARFGPRPAAFGKPDGHLAQRASSPHTSERRIRCSWEAGCRVQGVMNSCWY